MRLISRCVAFIALTATAALAQTVPSKDEQAREPLRARLIEEATRIEAAEVSPLFTAVLHPPADLPFRLDEGQTQHCRDLESLSRDVVRLWLLRGLDAGTPVEAGQMEARLSEKGRKLIESVFTHAEEIALKGILSTEQSNAWLKATKSKPRPRLPGRVALSPRNPPEDNTSNADLIDILKERARELQRAGRVFEIILGKSYIDRAFPDGIDNLDPKVKRQIDKYLPKVKLTTDQIDLARRLDTLTRKIVAAWIVRGLDDNPSPPRAALVYRYQYDAIFGLSLETHVEAIALDGILDPNQSDRCLAILWIRLGPECLLDPSLSSRLNLTRTQQERVKSILADKEAWVAEMGNVARPLLLQRLEQPELAAQYEEFTREIRNQMKVADNSTLNVLTISQLRLLKKLLSAADDQKPTPGADQKLNPGVLQTRD